jgi:hypothetical protein
LPGTDAAVWVYSAKLAREFVAPLGQTDPAGTSEAVFQVPLLLRQGQIARTTQ